MKITVNNHSCEYPEGTCLGQILRDLDLERPGTAVALNGRVVPAHEREQTAVADGAKIIVIGAVCGG